MAKGTGLIGNFKGKVGNTVGYKLSASNNGQTQGIRVYQPIVKNPKTAAQAEQRAKLAPINATYRALKMIIDRGNEGLPYGNKSRLAWLKNAFKAQTMPWFEKGASINYPVICNLTKGSLVGLTYSVEGSAINVVCKGTTSESSVATVGDVSTLLMNGYPSIQKGDQVTVVMVDKSNTDILTTVESFLIDPDSTEAQSMFEAGNGILVNDWFLDSGAAAIIVSREGANGEHLRSTASLVAGAAFIAAAPYDATSKAAAIASYRASAANNSDWAEESIQ